MSRKQRRASAKATRKRAPSCGGPARKETGQFRLSAARGLLASGRFPEAYAIYKSLVFDAPGDPSHLRELLRVLLDRCALAEAEAVAEKAAACFSGNSIAWLELGHIRQNLGRAEAAIAGYRHALHLDEGLADAWAGLAQVYERLHRLPEAMEAIDHAISLLPASCYLSHCRGVILRRQGLHGEAAQVQREVLAAAPTDDAATRHLALHELSQIHRAEGNAAASRQALIESKEAQAPLRAPFLQMYDAYQREVVKRFDGFDTQVVKDWIHNSSCADMSNAPRHAFIIGHPRSGTTLTQQVLEAHPSVLTLDEREALPHVEATLFGGTPLVADLVKVGSRERGRFQQLYLQEAQRYLAQPIGDQMLIDKRPDSLLVVPTIARMMPAARLLVVIRDPRDVCVSCFRQAFKMGVVSAQFHSIAATCRHYAWFMSHWLLLRDLLPKSMWMEVRYESLVSDCEGTARVVTDFLGLEWDDAVLSYQDAASRQLISTPSYTAVSQKPHTDAIGGWQMFREEIEACTPILQPYLDAWSIPRSPGLSRCD